MATYAKRRRKRVSSASCPPMFWTVTKPISGRNNPKASSAVHPASRSARPTSTREVCVGARMSHLLDVRAPEQALGQEDQGDDQDAERAHILVVDGKVGRPHGLDQADEQYAD